MNRNTRMQIWILLGILFANFIAQVFYFMHLYYTPEHMFPDLKSSLAIGSVLALFLVGSTLLITRHKVGYYLMAVFLSAQFLFYLWNVVGGAIRGYGWFFHVFDQDLILRMIFTIGYLSFIASGYMLWLLIYRGREFAR